MFVYVTVTTKWLLYTHRLKLIHIPLHFINYRHINLNDNFEKKNNANFLPIKIVSFQTVRPVIGSQKTREGYFWTAILYFLFESNTLFLSFIATNHAKNRIQNSISLKVWLVNFQSGKKKFRNHHWKQNQIWNFRPSPSLVIKTTTVTHTPPALPEREM